MTTELVLIRPDGEIRGREAVIDRLVRDNCQTDSLASIILISACACQQWRDEFAAGTIIERQTPA